MRRGDFFLWKRDGLMLFVFCAEITTNNDGNLSSGMLSLLRVWPLN